MLEKIMQLYTVTQPQQQNQELEHDAFVHMGSTHHVDEMQNMFNVDCLNGAGLNQFNGTTTSDVNHDDFYS